MVLSNMNRSNSRNSFIPENDRDQSTRDMGSTKSWQYAILYYSSA